MQAKTQTKAKQVLSFSSTFCLFKMAERSLVGLNKLQHKELCPVLASAVHVCDVG